MKSPITTHILDTTLGKTAQGVQVQLFYGTTQIAQGITNQDGRILDWLPIDHQLEAGQYQIRFSVGEWMQSQNRECFYPVVNIDFIIKNTKEHYHVPLLINPFGFSTYRGS
jgi:5-hydroxyisourate hydrolase